MERGDFALVHCAQSGTALTAASCLLSCTTHSTPPAAAAPERAGDRAAQHGRVV